jgi:asparaginyl-tRNA synthetase
MQFLLEYGCRFTPNGAWYIMPSFRGEEADETHLNQFFHSEAEISGGFDDVLAAVEDYVQSLAVAALDEFEQQIAAVAGTIDHVEALVSAGEFARITVQDAVDYLGNDPEAVMHDPAGFRLITRHGEQRLMREINPVIWLTHFDHLAVPFYQAYEPGTDLALNADLLFGIGEVVGAGERHLDGEQTRRALQRHNVAEADYEWYVRMKDEKPMQTAGFGLGIERWLMWLLRQPDIRELQVVPRYNGLALAP